MSLKGYKEVAPNRYELEIVLDGETVTRSARPISAA